MMYTGALRVGRDEFHILEAFIVAAIIYLILITIISLGVQVLQARMTTAKSGIEGSI
jgi:ABC-type amino acid transport system permease subunit